ncbi:MAG: protein translocase subunit SecF [Saezia sp.]
MEFFRFRKDVPFMKYALILNAFSLLVFIVAIYFLATRGLHLSSEFTGGTELVVRYEQSADLKQVRGTVARAGYGDNIIVQERGSSRDVMIRLPVIYKELTAEEIAAGKTQGTVMTAEEQSALLLTLLRVDHPNVIQESVDFIGPQIGEELVFKGLMALGLVVFGIIIYLAVRFEWKFGLAGVIANLHDVVIILGFFAFFQWEFSLSVLAGTLAVLGYSVNESVVVFDRIREAFRNYKAMNTADVINHAITSTMSRTIITHASTEAVVLSMFFFGGPTLHNFSLALTIGILFGIYSSVFVAAALVMWFGVKREDVLVKKKHGYDPNDPNAGAVV